MTKTIDIPSCPKIYHRRGLLTPLIKLQPPRHTFSSHLQISQMCNCNDCTTQCTRNCTKNLQLQSHGQMYATTHVRAHPCPLDLLTPFYHKCQKRNTTPACFQHTANYILEQIMLVARHCVLDNVGANCFNRMQPNYFLLLPLLLPSC